MLRRGLASLVSLAALSLLGACAMGVGDEGPSGLSGAYSGGPSDGSSGGTEGTGEESEGESEPAPATTGPQPPPSDDTSGDDGGNPLCCEPHATPGCESQATESCVCASRPSCCQAVWTDDCVDLAIACGDPFCEDDTTGGSTGGSTGEGSTGEGSTGEPDEPLPDEPPFPSCPCIVDPEVNNFCHYGPSHPGCPMTAPGGYCDPNGDGSFAEGDWEQGYYDWQAQCT